MKGEHFCLIQCFLLLLGTRPVSTQGINPPPEIEFRTISHTFAEGTDARVWIISTNINPPYSDLYVEVHPVDDTAENGMDYQFDVMNVTFSRRQVALPVPIKNDSIFEKNETFHLKIIIPNSWVRLGVSVSPTRNMTEVIITDNNSVEINFNPSEYTFREGTSNLHEISLSSSLLSSFSYEVQLLSTPMNASGDFRSFNGIATSFRPGSPKSPFSIVINNNNEYKGTRQFSVSFTISSDYTQFNIKKGPNTTALIIIEEDDNLKVSLKPNKVSIRVDQKLVPFTVVSNIAVTGNVNVRVNFLESGTILRQTELSFSIGETSINSNMDITGVTLSTGGEMYQLQLELLDPAPLVQLSTPSRIDVVIDRNDIAAIGFQDAVYRVVEGESVSLTIVSNKSFSASAVFAVVLRSNLDTATRDADYTIDEDLRYSFAGKTSTVSLTTLADSKCEKNETFTVGILSKNESVVVRPESTTAKVVILDSSSACDPPTDVVAIGFQDAVYPVVEGESVSLTIVSNKSFSASDVFAVVLRSNLGTATRDADYTINEDLRYSFAGKIATVSLTTLADSKCEKNETFTVGILSKNESVVVRPESTTAKVVILDSSSACDPPTARMNCSSLTDEWGYQWNLTLGNTTVTQPCSTDKTISGSVYRLCNGNGQWEETDVGQCQSEEFADILQTIDNWRTLSERNSIVTLSLSLAERLVDASYNRSFQNKSLFPSEIQTMNTYTSVIVEFSQRIKIFKNNTQLAEQVTSVFSNVLNSENTLGWSAIARKERDMRITLSQRLLENIEAISLLYADSTRRNNAAIFVRKNIGIISEKMSTSNESVTVTGDVLAGNNTFGRNADGFKVVIPGGVVSGQNTPVSTIIARNIGAYLSTQNSTSSQQLGSLLLSVNINSTSRSVSNLSSPINMTFPVTELQDKETTENESCVFWEIGSGWSNEGLTTKKLPNGSILCTATHLTSFSVLVDVAGITHGVDPVQQKVLSVATYVGCAFSLLCLLATIVFYLTMGKEIIKKLNNFVILNLCIALSCGLLVFCIGIETAKAIEGLCIFVTALLQYFFLATFCWMLCEAVILYNMLVKVFGAHKRKWIYFYTVLGWATPIPIVVISLGLSLGLGYNYFIEGHQPGVILACWLPTKNGLIWAFVGPMIAIVIVNTVLLVVVMRSLCRSNMGKSSEEISTDDNKQDRENALIVLKATVILLPLLGMTWIIGLFAADPTVSVAFAYIFVALNVLQGLFIFLFHVVRHDRIWGRIKACFSKMRGKSSLRESSTVSTRTGNRTTKINGNGTASHISMSELAHDNESIKDASIVTSSTFGKQ